jgi:hypothetical protein
MSRSTASPPPERGVVPGGHCRASEADEDEPRVMRPRHACQPVSLGARTARKTMSHPYAADGRPQTNPH